MSLETYIDLGSTTLGSSITSSATSLTLTSASSLPSTGKCRIIIDTEIISVTLNGTTTVTISRGIESSTAASHTSGATIYFILTAGSLNQSRLEQFNYDINSNRGLNGLIGRWFRDSDGNTMARDNGTTWNEFACCPPYIKPPVLSSMSPLAYADHSNSNYLYTMTQQGVGQYFAFTNTSSTTYQIGAYIVPVNASSAVAWSAVVGIQGNIPHNVYGRYGICIYESSSGKFTGCGPRYGQGALRAAAYNFTCGTTSGLAYTSYVGAVNEVLQSYGQTKMKFYKVIYNPTYYSGGLAFFQSIDGFNWTYFTRASFSNFNSMTQPTHVGFFADFSIVPAAYAGYYPGCNVFHWSYSEP
jgi:hypothetical protein